MRIDQFRQLVQDDPELISIAFNTLESREKPSKTEIVSRFFSQLTSQKENSLILLVSRLREISKHTDPKKERQSTKLIQKVREVFALNRSQFTVNSATQLDHLLNTHIYTESTTVNLDQFVLTLPQLLQLSHSLSHDTHILKTMAHILDHSQRHQKETHEVNRAEKLDAKYVACDGQNLILSSFPRDLSQITAYFNSCIKHDSKLLVSLQETSEHNLSCTHFWTNGILENVTLEDGWQIENVSSRVFSEGKIPNKKHILPRIVETILRATKEGEESRIITHLHCEGWIDFQQFSDERLLEILLDHIEELNVSPQPVMINCHAGIGRTGEVATCLILRRIIEKEQKRGTDLSTFPINILRLILELRKQRQGHVCGNLRQLPQICSMTYRFYQRCTGQASRS